MPDGTFEPQSGVTGVVKIIDKSQPLMSWAVKKAMEKLKRLLLTGNYVGENSPPLLEPILDEIIAQAKKADKEELETAGEIGHTAHDWIEQFIKSVLAGNEERRQELLAKMPTDERAANACIAAIEWMVRHNVRWISTERKCYSLLYGYAGTMDGLARVDSCTDPSCCPHQFKDRLTIVDWKTSNALYIEYCMQTAAYQQSYQEETGETIDDRWIIRLGKDDAKFDPWHIEGKALFDEDFHGFLNALALYKSVHSIEDRMGAVRTAKTAERKRVAREIKDAENAIRCPDADEYKGIRKKKGCAGLEKMCVACSKIYLDKHPELV